MSIKENRKKVVVLTGAGISAESGIKTFRDSGGLWENHDIMEVASPQGWAKDPALVLDFYNKRREQLQTVKPNNGHLALVELEKKFDVHIITQNVDDLHERAGSTKILHLHGELLKMRSCKYEHLVYDCTGDIKLGDECERGTQLRPHIVWFGEEVPMMTKAMNIAKEADIFIVVGTSLIVYPAASLIDFVGYDKPKYIVDPSSPAAYNNGRIKYISENATTGVPKLVDELMRDFS